MIIKSNCTNLQPTSKNGRRMADMTSRERVLKLLQGEKVDRPPVFSGMGNVIKPVLDKNGIIFSRVHRDPELMAKAAAGMYREYGFECAVVPFDRRCCREACRFGISVEHVALFVQRFFRPGPPEVG